MSYRYSSGHKRVLFLQVAEPGIYPPIIAASHLMADAGWEVIVLSSPSVNSELVMPPHPAITVHRIAERPSYIVSGSDFLRYMASAATLALRVKPDVVYASDSLGAAPGVLAARLSGARLVYHEHDSPNSQKSLSRFLAQARRHAVRGATLIVFPNVERATYAQRELDFGPERLRIVWNVPRRAELPVLVPAPEVPLVVWYHGSITPDRLPMTVVDAVASFNGRAQLQIAGYEAPSARGYARHLENRGAAQGGRPLVQYLGQISRHDLLARASAAHIGLALMPANSTDINMRSMVGASNKAFDYMAAGLPLIVSNLPDWRRVFVEPGHALAADPHDAKSLAMALEMLLENHGLRQQMGRLNRERIATEWNYETTFEQVLEALT